MIKKKRINYVLSLSVLFLIFFFININVGAKFDDWSFIKSFEEFDYNILHWTKHLWDSWTSRVIGYAVALSLMSSSRRLFAVVNAYMQTLIVWFIADFSDTDKGVNKNLLIAFAFVLYMSGIPYEVRMESDLWQMSTVAYLWGFVCALYCVRFFHNKIYEKYSISIPSAFVAVLCAIYAANCEQAAPVVIAYGVITELYLKLIRRQKFTIFNWVIIIVTSVGFAITMLAPGNAIRRKTEILMNVGYYPSTSLAEKLFFGIITSVKLIIQYYPQLMTLLSLLILLKVFILKKDNISKIIAGIPVLYFSVLTLFNWMKVNFPGGEIPFNLDYMFYDIIPVMSPSISYAPNQWISTVIAIYVCILMGVLLFTVADKKSNITNGLMFGAAFAIIAVIGFTVTGRVTGARTTFDSAILIILICTRLISDFLEKVKIK